MLLHREDVDIDALFLPDAVVVGVFVHLGTTVTNLGIEEEIMGVGVAVLQGKPVGKFVGQHFHQFQIIFSHHFDVEIIVPRNETSMSECTNEGAAAEPIADVMLLADTVDFEQDVEHTKLQTAQLGAIGIEARTEVGSKRPCHYMT